MKFGKESYAATVWLQRKYNLPNNTVCTDIFTIPYVRKSLANNSVALAISSIYDNSEQIKFSTYPILQNKQNLTYGVVGIRRDLLSKFRSICNENQVSLDAISFASNTAVNAAFAINSKLRNATFMLMDMKNDHTVITFVLNASYLKQFNKINNF